MKSQSTQSSKILILGGGFAGISAARSLSSNHSVTLVDKKTAFEWTPNLHELLSDVKTSKELSIDYASLMQGYGHRFRQDEVVQLEPATRHVHFRGGESENYDAVILAMGHTSEFYAIEGAKENTFAYKTIDDVLGLKKKIESTLAANRAIASETSITVVGGGFTGIEVLGELHRLYKNRSDVNLKLIEKQAHLLGNEYPSVSASIENLCSKQGITLCLNTQIDEVGEKEIHLTQAAEPASSIVVASDITIWTAGTQANDFKGNEEFSNTRIGLSVNAFLQALDTDANPISNVFIAGDLASTEKDQAKQSYHALNMGELAAKNCIRELKGKALCRHSPQAEVSLLSFGTINTYLLSPLGAASSPLLAAAKESIFQLQMANLHRGLPIDDQLTSLLHRNVNAITKLAIPQILSNSPSSLIRKSRLFGG